MEICFHYRTDNPNCFTQSRIDLSALLVCYVVFWMYPLLLYLLDFDFDVILKSLLDKGFRILIRLPYARLACPVRAIVCNSVEKSRWEIPSTFRVMLDEKQ